MCMIGFIKQAILENKYFISCLERIIEDYVDHPITVLKNEFYLLNKQW